MNAVDSLGDACIAVFSRAGASGRSGTTIISQLQLSGCSREHSLPIVKLDTELMASVNVILEALVRVLPLFAYHSLAGCRVN